MKEPILFNRLGSATEVTNSVIGSNMTQSGGSFVTGYFGNGFESNANGEYVYVNGLDTGLLNAGTVEFWYKPAYDYNVGSGYYLMQDGTNSSYRFAIIFDGFDDEFHIYMNKSMLKNTSGSPVGTWNFSSSFSAGDWLHLAVVWNDSGIDGGADTIRLYQNGSLQAYNNITNGLNTQFNVKLGNQHNNINNMNGVIDNYKIYTQTKTDFSDRFQERGGLNDQAVVL